MEIIPRILLLTTLVICVCTAGAGQYPVAPKDLRVENTENLPHPLPIFTKRLLTNELLAPSVNYINFDDYVFSDDNTITISPNRYADVSIYSPYSGNNTYLTTYFRWSWPNSLIVGYSVWNTQMGYYDIYSSDRMVIDFANPSKDVGFIWGQAHGTYSSGWVDIYTDNYALVTTLPVGLGSWTSFSLNQFSQRIKRVVLRRPNVANGLYGHIYLENLQFTPITTRSPVGTLESVSIQDGAALGWSADPDSPSSSNFVDCYIDNQLAGRVTANLPGAGAPYPGNHRFTFTIPESYKDGNNHQISCYGIDHSGGDPSTLLSGSPKTFNIPLNVISTEFVAVSPGALTQNNNPGGGLRMFPERFTPTGAVNNRVNIKAKISVNRAGVPVYFYSYDLDDPSASGPPVDVDNAIGQDNRATTKYGDLCPGAPSYCTIINGGYRILTDANGVAIAPFDLMGAHPGDNYAISATTDINETNQIRVNGIDLRNNTTGRVLEIGVDRTPMLTAWRTLNIEHDSMGTVVGNRAATTINGEYTIRSRLVPVPTTRTDLDSGRFNNGQLKVGSNTSLKIHDNSNDALIVRSLQIRVVLLPNVLYTLYDDDDFNSDNTSNGFDADDGEDVSELSDTFNLITPNDDTFCSDGTCNVFAAAYIQPSFTWGQNYSTSNVPFNLNVEDDVDQVVEQVDQGRNLNSGENPEFWVAYIQIGYQPSTASDHDPDGESCISGATAGPLLYNTNGVNNAAEVPIGGQGSLAYIEAMRDCDEPPIDLKLLTVPHEIGHQFGIRGDNSEPGTDFGLMGYFGGRNLVDRHLNLLRWRRRSPGV